jgi:hypothetical protein
MLQRSWGAGCASGMLMGQVQCVVALYLRATIADPLD